MALRGDQRALLQLICERGQSYEDISGLLGVTVDHARRQAREALTEIGGADPDAEVGLTDYLLGQADPIGRADAVRYLQSNPEALALAQRIEDGLREVAPGATLPKLPEPRGKRARAATPPPGKADEAPAPPPPARAGGPLASRQGRLIAGIGAAALILIVAILAIAGAFSGDDSDPGTTSADTETTTTPSEPTDNVTTVRLSPAGGSGVGGEASFGIVNDSQLYVDLQVSGLEPNPPRDQIYLAWLMVGEAGGYPINNPADSPIVPDENGNYSGRIAVPTPVAVTVGNQATDVRISASPVDEVARAAREATRQENQTPILPFVGDELASGKIPLQRAAGAGAGDAQGGG